MKCDYPFWVDLGSPGSPWNYRKPSADGSDPGTYWSAHRVPVPCGRCPNCRKRRVDDWVFRLQQEERTALSSLFVTLTYDVNTVPLSGIGKMTLDDDHPTNFFKRLRYYENKQFSRKKRPDLYFKALSKSGKPTWKPVFPIRYYLCAEYGTNRWRPHYHIILLNVKDTRNISKAWTDGAVDIRTVSGNAIAYTVGYINKLKRVPQFPGDDRQPEFSRMSQGLGESFLTPEMVRYFKADLTRLYCTKKDGGLIAIPRYYRKKLFTTGAEKAKQQRIIQDAMDEAEAKAYQDFCNTYGDDLDAAAYQAYKDACVRGRYHKFYSRIASKPRDKP